MPRAINSFDQRRIERRNNYSSITAGQFAPNLSLNNFIPSGDIVFTQPNDIITNGLVLYLDASIGNSYPQAGTIWRDLSGRGNNGTLTGGPTYSDANGGSIVLNGTNSIQIPDSTSLTSTSALTINAWVRPTALSAGQGSIIGKGTTDTDEEYCVVLTSSGLYFDVGNNLGPYAEPIYAFSFNTWYNVCCVHSRTAGVSSLPCYVNGVALGNATFAQTQPPGDNSHPVSIGRRFFGSTNGSFIGNISHVSIYNRALSAAEVAQNFNATRRKFGA